MTSAFWQLDVPPRATTRPPLRGSVDVDVAIVGAGFTGLWTARALLERDPTLDVLVLEAHTVGFGASGRNGAWLSPGIALGPTELARRYSPGLARETIRVMRDGVQQVADACTADGIDAQIRFGGMLHVARGVHELASMERSLAAYEAVGATDGLELLDPDALGRRISIAGAQGALFDPHAAVVHPGRLVHGLADAVERRGARIAERTRVTRVVPARRSRAKARTAHGEVRADTVVLANEAWLTTLPGHRRRLVPLYSLIVLTEPVGDDVLARIGWSSHELLASHRYTVDYLSRTVDGRILLGGRGAPYHYGSRISPSFDRHEPTHAQLRQQLVSWFPALAGIGFDHAWGGPLGMPRDWCPNVFHDPWTGVAGAYGYTGQGLTTSNVAGRALAGLIIDGHSPLGELPFVGHRSRRWEPEPVRWIAIRALQRALARIDDRSARTGRPSTGRTLAERLVRH